jgi:hypothetical protein
MATNKITNEYRVLQSPSPKRALALISFIAALLVLSAALAGAQQNAGATGTQSASNNPNGNTATVPTGTRMMVKMVDSVDSERNQANDRFRGSLEANLMAGDVVVAPKGTTVFGRLLTADSSGRSGGQLEFDLTDIVINGQTYSLSTSSNQAQGGTSSGGTGTGARTGAAVGALTGGIGGAVRGAGTGAIVGTAAGGSTSGERVNIPAGTLVEFNLDHPVSLPIVQR